MDPCASEMDKKTASQAALDIGFKDCLDCKHCRCGVGIDIKTDVIRPLLQANNLIGTWILRPIKRRQNRQPNSLLAVWMAKLFLEKLP